MKRLLLTGGSGLLALNWARAMGGSWQVHLALNRRLVSLAGIGAEVIDLGTDGFGEALDRLRPDLVVNTAGLTDVEACERDPDAAHLANVTIPGNIAAHTARRGIGFVHISTDHLFDGVSLMLDEDSPVAPLNVYAASKARGEAAVLDANGAALVVRTNFYGWGPSYRRSFSDRILDALREGRETVLFEDVHFTPIDIDALVLASHELVAGRASGIYNVVGDERLSKYDFGLNVANRFRLDAGLIRPGRMTDRAELTRRPLEMSLSNRKLAAFLKRDLGDVAAQFQRLSSIEADPQVKEVQQL